MRVNHFNMFSFEVRVNIYIHQEKGKDNCYKEFWNIRNSWTVNILRCSICTSTHLPHVSIQKAEIQNNGSWHSIISFYSGAILKVELGSTTANGCLATGHAALGNSLLSTTPDPVLTVVHSSATEHQKQVLLPSVHGWPLPYPFLKHWSLCPSPQLWWKPPIQPKPTHARRQETHRSPRPSV